MEINSKYTADNREPIYQFGRLSPDGLGSCFLRISHMGSAGSQFFSGTRYFKIGGLVLKRLCFEFGTLSVSGRCVRSFFSLTITNRDFNVVRIVVRMWHRENVTIDYIRRPRPTSEPPDQLRCRG